RDDGAELRREEAIGRQADLFVEPRARALRILNAFRAEPLAEPLQDFLERSPVGHPAPEFRLLVKLGGARRACPRDLARDLFLEVRDGVGGLRFRRRLEQLATSVEPQREDLSGARVHLARGRDAMTGPIDGHGYRGKPEAFLRPS